MVAGLTGPVRRYLFDQRGYILLRRVLSCAEVRELNREIDINREHFVERPRNIANVKLTDSFQGLPRIESGRILEFAEAFRKLLVHPKLVDTLNDFLGPGFRLDHLPLAIIQVPDGEGFDLHGGRLNSKGQLNFEINYQAAGDRVFPTLLNVAYCLTDVEPGEGGFVIVPGSHKASFALPEEIMKNPTEYEGLLDHPTLQAGDVIVFSEATMHGVLRWTGKMERRTVFYRYSPATCAYGRGYTFDWAPEIWKKFSKEQKKVLAPPYTVRLNRPTLGGEAEKRHPDKVKFDELVYGREYF